MQPTCSNAARLLQNLTPAEQAELDYILELPGAVWAPQPGPQSLAYNSTADVIGYGGAAGGGKTDLGIGKALTQHQVVAAFRREGTELNGMIDRMKAIVGHDEGYVGAGRWWGWRNPVPGVQIEFAGVPNAGDETKHQGRPKDLLLIDEAANFLESQVRFLMGWVRSTDPNQRCQTLLLFNPPTSAEGRWLIPFFAPWLDENHPCPALPGELRWFAMIDGKEREVSKREPFEHNGEIIVPKSRTFIPARVADNKYLYGTGYVATLQALPEPLRSQMLHGDFNAGVEDDPYQVIPTKWVDAAMARWKPMDKKPPMDSVGVDVSRGGKDKTVIARRHGRWYDKPLTYGEQETDTGPKVAGLVIAATRDNAVQHVDIIGVGSSPYDFLVDSRQQVLGVSASEKSFATDKSGRLKFFNVRSELWWKFRESLDPASNNAIALPLDSRLRADLCAPKWRLKNVAIQIESREEIIKRIGRSPDFASAYVLARMDTPKATFKYVVNGGVNEAARREYDPLANDRS